MEGDRKHKDGNWARWHKVERTGRLELCECLVSLVPAPRSGGKGWGGGKSPRGKGALGILIDSTSSISCNRDR